MKTFDKIVKDVSNLPVEARRALVVFICLIGFIALMYGRETADSWEHEFVSIKPKLKIRELMSACLDVVERGGKEVVRIRGLADIGEKSKGHTRDGANDPVTEGDMASHRIMYYGLKKAFPDLVVVSEERDNQDTDVPMPFLNNEEFNNIGEEIETDRITVWLDPLDATQEYTEGLTQYVTVMAGIAIDGIAIGGIIHKPFSNETLWSFGDRKNTPLTFLMIYDDIRMESEENLKFIVSRSHAGNIRNQVERYVKPAPTVTAAGGSGYKIWEIVKGDYDVYVHSAQIKKWDLCAGEAILSTANGQLTDLTGARIDYKSQFDYKVENGVIASKVNHHALVKGLKNIIV